MKSGLDLYRQNRLLTNNLRDLEAEIFRQVAFGLRQHQHIGGLPLARAVAQARILWMSVHDLVCDDNNRLPLELRQNLASLARRLLADMDKPLQAVDVEFLASVTISVAEGLEVN